MNDNNYLSSFYRIYNEDVFDAIKNAAGFLKSIQPKNVTFKSQSVSDGLFLTFQYRQNTYVGGYLVQMEANKVTKAKYYEVPGTTADKIPFPTEFQSANISINSPFIKALGITDQNLINDVVIRMKEMSGENKGASATKTPMYVVELLDDNSKKQFITNVTASVKENPALVDQMNKDKNTIINKNKEFSVNTTVEYQYNQLLNLLKASGNDTQVSTVFDTFFQSDTANISTLTEALRTLVSKLPDPQAKDLASGIEGKILPILPLETYGNLPVKSWTDVDKALIYYKKFPLTDKLKTFAETESETPKEPVNPDAPQAKKETDPITMEYNRYSMNADNKAIDINAILKTQNVNNQKYKFEPLFISDIRFLEVMKLSSGGNAKRNNLQLEKDLYWLSYKGNKYFANIKGNDVLAYKNMTDDNFLNPSEDLKKYVADHYSEPDATLKKLGEIETRMNKGEKESIAKDDFPARAKLMDTILNAFDKSGIDYKNDPMLNDYSLAKKSGGVKK